MIGHERLKKIDRQKERRRGRRRRRGKRWHASCYRSEQPKKSRRKMNSPSERERERERSQINYHRVW
jgi:hypothetical protein